MRKHKHELGLLKDVLVFSSILVTLGSTSKVLGSEQNQVQQSENQAQYLAVHPVDPLNPGVEATPVPPSAEATKTNDINEKPVQIVEDELDLPDGSQKIVIKAASKKELTNQSDDQKKRNSDPFSPVIPNPDIVSSDPFNDFAGGGDDDMEEPSYLEEVFSNLSGVMLFGTAPI